MGKKLNDLRKRVKRLEQQVKALEGRGKEGGGKTKAPKTKAKPAKARKAAARRKSREVEPAAEVMKAAV